MIHLEIRTWLREQTLTVFAGTCGQLLLTGGLSKLRRGASHVVDIALEQRILRHLPCLRKDGFMASCLHDSALMEGQGAEGAAAKAPPVRGQGEPHLGQGGNAAVLVVHRMPLSRIGQGIDIVHLHRRQRLCRRVLDHERLPAVGLEDALCLERVRILVLDLHALCKGHLVLQDGLIVREPYRIIDALLIPCLVYRPVDPGDIPDVKAG